MLNRFFNGRIRGIPAGGWNVFCGVWRSLARRMFSGVKLCGLGRCGKNCRLGLGVVVRYPGGIVLSDGVSIADNCFITSEFPDSRLEIGSDSHINRFCHLDFSGGVVMGKNCTISEGVVIESHDHGHDPGSVPERCPLRIGDEVWIGMRSIILPRVARIGDRAIIGAGAVVTREVPPRAVVAGNPARVIKYLE